jgi:hypothetical protein
MTRAEYLAEAAEWADQWAADLQRELERATQWYDPDLDLDGVQLSLRRTDRAAHFAQLRTTVPATISTPAQSSAPAVRPRALGQAIAAASHCGPRASDRGRF